MYHNVGHTVAEQEGSEIRRAAQLAQRGAGEQEKFGKRTGERSGSELDVRT